MKTDIIVNSIQEVLVKSKKKIITKKMKISIIQLLFLISLTLFVKVRAQTTSRTCLCIRPCPTRFACLETNNGRCSCIEIGFGRKREIQFQQQKNSILRNKIFFFSIYYKNFFIKHLYNKFKPLFIIYIIQEEEKKYKYI